MGRNPHRFQQLIPPLVTPGHVSSHIVLRVHVSFGRLISGKSFIAFSSTFHNFPMASAAGRRSKKPPALPSGFQFDIPLLRAVGIAEQVEQADPDAIALSHDEKPHTRPPSEPPAPTNCGHQSADLRLLALQIEQQKLEIKKLELEAQIKANTTSPLVKPESVPSLSTVRQSPNAGKSLGQ